MPSALHNNLLFRAAFVLALCGFVDRSHAIEVVVGRYTGQVSLVNTTTSPSPTAGYSINSVSGSLLPANWLSVTNNYDANSSGSIKIDPDDNWTIISSTINSLAEGQISGVGPNDGGSLAAGQVLSLGTIWNPAGLKDLTANVLTNTGPATPVIPTYTLAADFDENFRVDRSDLVLWRLCFLGGCSFGDADQNSVVDGRDYLIWLQQVGQTLPTFQTSELGFGSAVGASSVTIPEPSAIALAAAGFLAAFIGRRFGK